MKATPDEFRAAVAPVLADVERSHPGLLMVVEEPESTDLSAIVRERGGAGTGVTLSSGYEGVDAVAEMTGLIQEVVFEALWTTWPTCPSHPTTHPLDVAVNTGHATWICPATREQVAVVGALGL